MAEKLGPKLNPKSIQSPSQTSQQTDKSLIDNSDKAFLERNNVNSLMRELLENLYHHQPEQPLNYICT